MKNHNKTSTIDNKKISNERISLIEELILFYKNNKDLKKEITKWKQYSTQTISDLENYKKRTIRENQYILENSKIKIINPLLSILDNLKIGLFNINKKNIEELELFKGIEIVIKQLNKFFIEQGIININPKNEYFNPELHEAISYINNNNINEGYIIEVVREGYMFNKKLIRPASVVVSKGK